MKFIAIALVTGFSFSAFASQPFKDCGLKSNNTIVFVDTNGTIKQYVWFPSELNDVDLYNKVKNGTYLCVAGELNSENILVGATLKK
jgi:hypothetical protein